MNHTVDGERRLLGELGEPLAENANFEARFSVEKGTQPIAEEAVLAGEQHGPERPPGTHRGLLRQFGPRSAQP